MGLGEKINKGYIDKYGKKSVVNTALNKANTVVKDATKVVEGVTEYVPRVGLGAGQLFAVLGYNSDRLAYGVRTDAKAKWTYERNKKKAWAGEDVAFKFRLETGRLLVVNVPFSQIFLPTGQPTPAGVELLKKIADQPKGKEADGIKVLMQWLHSTMSGAQSKWYGELVENKVDPSKIKKGQRYYREQNALARQTLGMIWDGAMTYLENAGALTPAEVELFATLDPSKKEEYMKRKKKDEYSAQMNKLAKSREGQIYKFPEAATTILPKKQADLLKRIIGLMPREGTAFANAKIADIARLLDSKDYANITPNLLPQFLAKIGQLKTELSAIDTALLSGLPPADQADASAKISQMVEIIDNTMRYSAADSIKNYIRKKEASFINSKDPKVRALYDKNTFDKTVEEMADFKIDPAKGTPAFKQVLRMLIAMAPGDKSISDELKRDLPKLLEINPATAEAIVAEVIDDDVYVPLQNQVTHLRTGNPAYAQMQVLSADIVTALQEAADAVNPASPLSKEQRSQKYNAARQNFNLAREEIRKIKEGRSLTHKLTLLDQTTTPATIVDANAAAYEKLANQADTDVKAFTPWEPLGGLVALGLGGLRFQKDQIGSLLNLEDDIDLIAGGVNIVGLEEANTALLKFGQDLGVLGTAADTARINLLDKVNNDPDITSLAAEFAAADKFTRESTAIASAAERRVRAEFNKITPGDWAGFVELINKLTAGTLPVTDSVFSIPSIAAEVTKRRDSEIKRRLDSPADTHLKGGTVNYLTWVQGQLDNLYNQTTLAPVAPAAPGSSNEILFQGSEANLINVVRSEKILEKAIHKVVSYEVSDKLAIDPSAKITDITNLIDTAINVHLLPASWAGQPLLDAPTVALSRQNAYFDLVSDSGLRVLPEVKSTKGGKKSEHAITLFDVNSPTVPFFLAAQAIQEFAQALQTMDAARFAGVRSLLQSKSLEAVRAKMNSLPTNDAGIFATKRNALNSDINYFAPEIFDDLITIKAEINNSESKQLRDLLNTIDHTQKLELQIAGYKDIKSKLTAGGMMGAPPAIINITNFQPLLDNAIQQMFDKVTPGKNLPRNAASLINIASELQTLVGDDRFKPRVVELIGKMAAQETTSESAKDLASFDSWLSGIRADWGKLSTEPAANPLLPTAADYDAAITSKINAAMPGQLGRLLKILLPLKSSDTFEAIEKLLPELTPFIAKGLFTEDQLNTALLPQARNILDKGMFTSYKKEKVLAFFQFLDRFKPALDREVYRPQLQLAAIRAMKISSPISDPVSNANSLAKLVTKAIADFAVLFPDPQPIRDRYQEIFLTKVEEYLSEEQKKSTADSAGKRALVVSEGNKLKTSAITTELSTIGAEIDRIIREINDTII